MEKMEAVAGPLAFPRRGSVAGETNGKEFGLPRLYQRVRYPAVALDGERRTGETNARIASASGHVDRTPVIPDLPALRDKMVFAFVNPDPDLDTSGPVWSPGAAGAKVTGVGDDDNNGRGGNGDGHGYRPTTRSSRGLVGIPRTMYTYDRLPFWSTFLQDLGFDLLVSGETDRKIKESGIENTVAEPCFPIRAAHGHVAWLEQSGATFGCRTLDRET